MGDTSIDGQTGQITDAALIADINEGQPGAIGATALTATQTYDPASLTTGTQGAIQTVTVTGAQLGQRCSISFSLDTQGIMAYAWVSAANTVSYVFRNGTAGTLDIASGTVKVWVHQS